MAEVTGSNSWREELVSLVEDTAIRFNGDATGISTQAFEGKGDVAYESPPTYESAGADSESLKDQIKGFAQASVEMLVELGRGCRDVLQQSFLTEDSYIVRKTRGPLAEVSGRLKFMNKYLPEDRDPMHAWPVILFVFIIAFAVLNVNTSREPSIRPAKKVIMHPPSAARIQLPDGRYIAYREQGVSAERARFSLIVPHDFLSSRLAGIPGINTLLLEEFGINLISYDRPGFGESDPHPERNLSSSALDMASLADAIGVHDKFWVLGYSSGAIHAWAALKYIPHRIAGTAMIAPLVNPYGASMTKDEISGTWKRWTRRKKFLYYLARRFPRFLSYFYNRTFLSGKHGPIEKWLAITLSQKDKILTEVPAFQEFWHRDMEESIRQGNPEAFIEEAAMQVSNWGFGLEDLQVKKKCSGRGLPWLKFIYGEPKCELTGFLGSIHIWQGMDDWVVPPPMINYTARVLPNAVIHNLSEEGHFSFFYFCDECHKQILSTIFGSPKGPLEAADEVIKEDAGQVLADSNSTIE